MFGCIVAGRLVQTDWQQVDDHRLMLRLENASSINHLVVFLTGTRPFDPGYAATVFVAFEPTPVAGGMTGIQETQPNWELLGMLSNEKPSAIFKVSGLKKANTTIATMNGVAPQEAPLLLGISMEPEGSVRQQLAGKVGGFGTVAPTLKNALNLTTPAMKNDAVIIAQKIVENFMNYCMSFSTKYPSVLTTPAPSAFGQPSPMPSNQESFIPTRALKDWYKNLVNKVKSDPNFVKTLFK